MAMLLASDHVVCCERKTVFALHLFKVLIN